MNIKNLIPRAVTNWLVSLLVALTLCCAQQKILAAEGHWVTTWATAPQLTEPGNIPPAPYSTSSMSSCTLRQFVRTSIGGKHLRVRFSNAYGTDSVTINAASIALAPATASGGNGDIYTATDKGITFRGAPVIVIPRGEVVFSDPIEFDLPATTNVAISIYFGKISASTINGHPGSRSTSFIQSGNVISAANLASATKTTHWYIITGMEVLADSSSKAISILGDSITDGRGSTDNGNNRWPDILAQRLVANAPTAGVGVANMGVGGGAVLSGGLGPTALVRFDRDVLSQNGVRYLIVFEGVNDLGGGASAASLISAYQQFANKAHARNIRAYGATITPLGNTYYTAGRETQRQLVNTWFRTNTLYDGVIDFDAVVRDPGNPSVIKAEYFSGVNANDGLHLNTAGLKAMGDSIDLNLFTP